MMNLDPEADSEGNIMDTDAEEGETEEGEEEGETE